MASSAGNDGAGAAIQRYFCHQCDRTVSVSPSPTDDVACPICGTGFLEEIETPAPAPRSYATPSDPSFASQPPIFFPGSSSGRPMSAGATAAGAFSGSGPPGASVAVAGDNFDSLNNTLQFLFGRLQDLTAGGARIQLIIENHPGGSFGDYFVGPGLEQLIQQLAENDPNRYGTPPASKSVMDSLPDIKVSLELLASDEAQCAVCKDTFEVGKDVKQMPCEHLYHKDCIIPWLELHNSCPVCRYEVPTDDPGYERRTRGATPPRISPVVGNEDGPVGAEARPTAASMETSSPGGSSGERISLPWSIRNLFGGGASGRDGSDGGTSSGSGDGNSSAGGDQRS